MITSTDSFKSTQIRSLTRVPAGDQAVVVAINTEQELQGRLMGMGLFVGTKVDILQGGEGKHGPLLLGIGNTRIALGRDIASVILAEDAK